MALAEVAPALCPNDHLCATGSKSEELFAGWQSDNQTCKLSSVHCKT